MIKRCHSLKNSQINLRSVKKINKNSNNHPLQEYPSNSMASSLMPSIKCYDIHESPLQSNHKIRNKQPLKIGLQKTVETNCTTSSRKHNFHLSSRINSINSEQLTHCVRPFQSSLKNYDSENIRIEDGEKEIT